MFSLLEKFIRARNTGKLLNRFADITRKYFRIEIEGIENIPNHGKAVIAPNHSGYSGADAIMIHHIIHQERRRLPKILAHRAFFEFEFLKQISNRFGLEKVSAEAGTELLKKEDLVLVFPEGESGNFKPSSERYNLQRFHTGFIRMAIQAQAPIIPCLVIGAEESYLNLGSIDCSRYMKGLRLPIPLNLVPFPAKWKIKFLKPVSVTSYASELSNDRNLTLQLSSKIQKKMQRALRNEIKKRNYIYFPNPDQYATH